MNFHLILIVNVPFLNMFENLRIRKNSQWHKNRCMKRFRLGRHLHNKLINSDLKVKIINITNIFYIHFSIKAYVI